MHCEKGTLISDDMRNSGPWLLRKPLKFDVELAKSNLRKEKLSGVPESQTIYGGIYRVYKTGSRICDGCRHPGRDPVLPAVSDHRAPDRRRTAFDRGKEDAAISKYTPEKLVAVSRCQSYFPTLPGDIQSDAYTRIAELNEEEKTSDLPGWSTGCQSGLCYAERYMRQMIDYANALADERRIPVILDTDDRDKAARYEHLGMKLDRVSSCGERFHMYDLIRE